MGIKNMPSFDDFDFDDVNQSSTNNTKPSTSGSNMKGFIAALGITTKEQLKPILAAFGFDQNTIEAVLSSFSTLDELLEAMDNLPDDDSAALPDTQGLAQMISSMMQGQMQGQPAPQQAQPNVNRSVNTQSKDAFSSWESDDVNELELIIDSFLNSKTNSEECVSELCELLGDLDYCFNGDLQQVENDLDNMRNNGTTTREIKQYLSANIGRLQNRPTYQQNTSQSCQSCGGSCSDDEEDDDDIFNDNPSTDESEESKEPTKVFNDVLKTAMEREVKLFSIKYVPFSAKEFKTHFDINEDDLEDNKIPISKFADIIPEKWSEDFDFITLATAFIEEENQFILCYQVPNFGKTSTIPASFLIYKDSSGFHSYVIMSENVVNSDGSLLTLEDVFTPEAINYIKKDVEKAAEEAKQNAMGIPLPNIPGMTSGISGFSMGAGFPGFPMGNQQQPQNTDATIKTKLNKTLYKTLLQAIGGYDEKRMFDRCTKLMIKENSNPLMTLHMLGTLEPSLETKQYKEGYVYVGDVTLNDSEDVKYFLSDFELKPVNGKLEFYVKMENSEIKKNNLPKYKDYIRTHFDFNDDAFQNRLEVQPLDNIVFIEF